MLRLQLPLLSRAWRASKTSRAMMADRSSGNRSPQNTLRRLPGAQSGPERTELRPGRFRQGAGRAGSAENLTNGGDIPPIVTGEEVVVSLQRRSRSLLGPVFAALGAGRRAEIWRSQASGSD